MKSIILSTILIVLFIGCKKPNERTCIKNSGTETIKLVDLSDFPLEGFSIFNNINVSLIQDTANFAVISSFENIVDLITFEMVDSLVEIRDLNKCSFLRDYDKQTNITIHYDTISVLSLNGNGKITTLAPIENDIVHIYALSSNSHINIEVKAISFIAKLVNGTLSGTIKGKGDNSNIFHAGHSNINFEELIAQNLRLTNKSDANVYLNTSNTLFLELLSLGKIYYKGTPTIEVFKNRFESDIVNNN